MRPALIALVVTVLPGGAPAQALGDFSGTWETTFGEMTLRQVGARVTGGYNGGATLQGTVEKNRLTFTYQEPAVAGEGWFELAADGRSFAGKWREQDRGGWQAWVGKRLAGIPEPNFTGLWNTTFGPMRLTQKDNNVQGIYVYAGGSSIAGTVESQKLTFRYTEPQAQGEGWFQLADAGTRFRGKWRARGTVGWHDWQGTRVEPKPGRVWLTVVEANWESHLAEPEYSFGKMLRAFFERVPHVQVRHRFFTDEVNLRRWCHEVAYLPEPVVLVVATHGSAQGVTVGGRTVSLRTIADGLQHASNLKLVHFSACEIMKGKGGPGQPGVLGTEVPFPVSGYTTPVDWAASAIIEFTYFDMILSRGMTPSAAADQVRKLLPFAGDKPVPGAALRAAGFRLVMPAVKRLGGEQELLLARAIVSALGQVSGRPSPWQVAWAAASTKTPPKALDLTRRPGKAVGPATPKHKD